MFDKDIVKKIFAADKEVGGHMRKSVEIQLRKILQADIKYAMLIPFREIPLHIFKEDSCRPFLRDILKYRLEKGR